MKLTEYQKIILKKILKKGKITLTVKKGLGKV